MGAAGPDPRENGPVEREAQVQAALVRAARILSSTLDIDEACAAVLEAVEDVFAAKSSWILLHEPDARVLRTKLFRGIDAEVYADAVIPEDRGIVGIAFRSRQVVFVPNVRAEDRWFDSVKLHRSRLKSILMLPLVHEDTTLGVVGLDSPLFTAEAPPGHNDIEPLEALAAQAAIAITNARRYQDSEEDRRRLRALLNERHQVRRQVRRPESGHGTSLTEGDIVGTSRPWREVLAQAELVAASDTTVLLHGETGTGKELIAQLVHQRSPRAGGAFVAVNCAALPSTLVESELFGHEKGAFTSAISTKIGKFEVADGGTLFLDEIGDLPAEAQAKLLRVLQDSELQRVGSTQSIHVNVRVIAATNQDLATAIAENRFRRDLFYRISAFPIRIAPLRDRMEDVPGLAAHFARVLGAKLGKGELQLHPEAVNRLLEYSWPGNVRELANIVERAVILSTGEWIGPELIEFPTAGLLPESDVLDEGEVVPLADAERAAIQAALVSANWRISGRDGAADRLGLKPTTLHAKMRKLGIRRPYPRRVRRQAATPPPSPGREG